MNMLVIQTAFLGDLILTTPLIREIHVHFKNVNIDVLAIPQTAEFLENNPHIRDIILFDKKEKLWSMFKTCSIISEIRKRSYDIGFLPHRSFRSALIAFLGGVKRRLGFTTSPGSFLYTDKITYKQDIHEIERNLKLLDPFEASISDKTPEVYFNEVLLKKIDGIHNTGTLKEANIIGICPGSVWATKRWIPERFAKVADRLIANGMNVVFFGSAMDIGICNSVLECMDHKALNLAGQTSILESTALMKQVDVLVTNDSASMHMGVAVKTPVIAIYGPTVPEFGFFPFGKDDIVVENHPACRPCSMHGGNRCPTGTFECMKNISVDMVYDEVLKKMDTKQQL